MGRLLKFLFGLTIGAGAALLVTPKTGREVRGMLSGSPVRGLMPARLAELSRPRDFSEPEGSATAVAEPPTQVAEPERESFVAPEPISRICIATVQPRRSAYSRIARFCIARVC